MAEVPTRHRENTRTRLLEAAFAVFAEVGLDAASVEEVCERAGFTRGAFYSNFPSKDALFLELVSAVSTRKLAAVTERVRSITDGAERPDDPAEVVRQLVDVAMDSRNGVLLAAEMRARAMRDPQMAEPYRRWLGEMVQRVAAIADELVAAYDMRLRVPAADLAQTLLDLWQSASVEAIIAGMDETTTAELLRRRTQTLAAGLVEGFRA